VAPIRRFSFTFYLATSFVHFLVNHHLVSNLGLYFAMSALSYMPLQTHDVHNSVPPPTASENPSSYDEHKGNLSTASIKSENPHWDLGNSTRKAPQAPRGMVQLMKSLLLPLVGEGVHLERPSTSDAVHLSHCVSFLLLHCAYSDGSDYYQ